MVLTEDVATGPDEGVGCSVLDKEVSIPEVEEGVPGTEEEVPVMAGVLLGRSRSCEVIDDPVIGKTKLQERMSRIFKRKGPFCSLFPQVLWSFPPLRRQAAIGRL